MGQRVFPYETDDKVLIILPTGDSLGIEERQLVLEINSIHKLIDESDVEHVVIDLSSTPYLGSLIIGALMVFCRKVRDRNGGVAMCAAKAGVKDALEIMRMGDIIPYHEDRAAALAFVRGTEVE